MIPSLSYPKKPKKFLHYKQHVSIYKLYLAHSCSVWPARVWCGLARQHNEEISSSWRKNGQKPQLHISDIVIVVNPFFYIKKHTREFTSPGPIICLFPYNFVFQIIVEFLFLLVPAALTWRSAWPLIRWRTNWLQFINCLSLGVSSYLILSVIARWY